MPAFVHLHTHSDYSLLDGAQRIPRLVARAVELGMPAVAVTDHGNLFGAYELLQACQGHKGADGQPAIKGIVGCEFYVTAGRLEERSGGQSGNFFHLVLLAEDNTGYRNLCQLNAKAWNEGFYYKPRIDFAALAAHKAGLIALTACIGGEIPQAILRNDEARARELLERYAALFGPDRFYLELQSHVTDAELAAARGRLVGAEGEARRAVEDLIELGEAERRSNAALAGFGREYNLPLVATNDAHYLRREHAKAHEVLLCVGTQTALQDPKRFRFAADSFYFKDAAEMAALFPDQPEALANTVRIAGRCNVEIKYVNHYPVYGLPAEFAASAATAADADAAREQCLRRICAEGLKARHGIDAGAPASWDAAARAKVERLEYEIGVIRKMGFISYFLVVWDFIHHAKGAGIPVGPGRGSGAGSLVAYLMRITDIDPIRYGLLFERFLNPDRVSPPDFDIDFCERRRQEVIEYVRGKYGAANVAQIGTFGTLKAKQVLKDVARALGRTPAEGMLLSKHVPEDPKMTLAGALGEDPKHPEWESKDLKELVAAEPWAAEVLQYARVLEGLCRNTGIHAAGVIIGDMPVGDVVPLGRGAGGEVITQYPAPACEAVGLLKMDFLGLKTLTIIDDAVRLIAENTGGAVDLETLPLDDPKTFELLSAGDTVGVFQLESAGFQKVCRQMKVNRFEEISALLAIYRPGPMAFIPEYCDSKFGRKPIVYDHPIMKEVLEETYGIMLYQEQVMQAVQRLAGFSLGQADILRRAMSKKKLDEMKKLYEKYLAGCLANQIPEATAKAIWDKIVMFANYGFNKSHSAAYGLVTYRTAWLKAHHPVEFMAAMLTSELGNAEKLAFLLQATRDMGIAVLPPAVNVSRRTFTVDGAQIRFGLAAIKGVGEGAADAIAAARRAGGPFKSLDDFCERTAASLNRRVLESLCKAGAFDEFGLRRAQVFAMLDELLARASRTAKDRQAGQGSLFDFGGAEAAPMDAVAPPAIPEWLDKELLGYEKELLGVYVSGHPLRQYKPLLETYQTASVERVAALPPERDGCFVRTGGLVGAIKTVLSKKDGRKMAFINLEGAIAAIEVSVFANTFEKYGELLQPDRLLFVEGQVQTYDREGNPGPGKIVAERLATADQAREQWTAALHLRLKQGLCAEGRLAGLLQACRGNPGPVPVIFCLLRDDGTMAFVEPAPALKVADTPAWRQAVADLFGAAALYEKAAPPVEPPRSKFRDGGGRRNGNGNGNGGPG
ncbi:MAG: DNA polymerase III subunit alpha [Lentisphaeria bacterium]|jgi:DNA polymerase-3 subunit alpha